MLDALIPHIPVVGCDGQGGFITPTHTTGLGAGPEVYNNMAASHNCVGGSEQGCIPKNPPVGNPAFTGSSSSLPAPAHWYAHGGHVQGPEANHVSLADWHKSDDPWGAYLVDHHPAQGHTVYVPYGQGGPDVHGCASGTPGCYANGEHGAGLHTTALGAGPEVYNNMAASHNCVGGSEQGCIPKNPPVGNPAFTGSSSTLPAPAHWYANGEHGAGLHTTQLGAGPEVYNNMAASHNCVGGSEQGCIPKNPPVGNPALTGQSSTLPAPAHWYANGCGNGGLVAKEAAVPAFAPATAEVKKHSATPGHAILACHAFTLAAFDSVCKQDFSHFQDKVAANAESVTPVGAAVLRQHLFVK